jgi:hypothetical protein
MIQPEHHATDKGALSFDAGRDATEAEGKSDRRAARSFCGEAGRFCGVPKDEHIDRKQDAV